MEPEYVEVVLDEPEADLALRQAEYRNFLSLFQDQARWGLPQLGPGKLYIPHDAHGPFMDDVYEGVRLDVAIQAHNKAEAVLKLRNYLAQWSGRDGQPIDILRDAYDRVLFHRHFDLVSDVLTFEKLFEGVMDIFERGPGLIIHEAELI